MRRTPSRTLSPLVLGSAHDLRSMLVHSLAHAGAADAAQAQYRVLAAAYERETGEPPPAFERLTARGHGKVPTDGHEEVPTLD